jgi:hypothetical protein
MYRIILTTIICLCHGFKAIASVDETVRSEVISLGIHSGLDERFTERHVGRPYTYISTLPDMNRTIIKGIKLSNTLYILQRYMSY